MGICRLSLVFGILFFCATNFTAQKYCKQVVLKDGAPFQLEKVDPMLCALHQLGLCDPVPFRFLIEACKKQDVGWSSLALQTLRTVLAELGFLKCRAIIKDGIFLDVEEYIVPEVASIISSAVVMHEKSIEIADPVDYENTESEVVDCILKVQNSRNSIS